MKKIIFLIFLTIFLSSCWEEEKQIVKYYSTWTVLTGSINTWESFIWYTTSFNTINLAPKVWWKIVTINYKEWDKIKAWSLVATLDWSEAKSWYSSAENILDTLMKLKVSTSWMFDEQINAMKAKISQAETWVKWTSAWVSNVTSIWEEQLKTILTQKEELKNIIKNTKEVLNQKESDLYGWAKNAISSSMIIDTNVIVFLDELLWITDENDNKNDSFENYLWAKNTSLKTTSENNFLKVYPKYQEYKLDYENKILNWTITNEEIEVILKDWIELNTLLRDLLKTTYDVVDSSVASSSF